MTEFFAVVHRSSHDHVMQAVAPTSCSPREFLWELPPGPGPLSEARSGFERWLAGHSVDAEDSAELAVVLSELGANACTASAGHDSGSVAIRAWCADAEVVLEVENARHDDPDDFVVDLDDDPLRGSGRGLLIVSAYTDTVELIPPDDQGSGLIVRCHKQV